MNMDETIGIACLSKLVEGNKIKVYPLPHKYVGEDLGPNMARFYAQHNSTKEECLGPAVLLQWCR